MKNFYTKFFLISIIFLITLCANNYAQMLPQLSIRNQVGQEKIEEPNTASNTKTSRNGAENISAAEGTIIITYPSGGEVFEAGSNPTITYTSIGNSGLINLDYSTDGGVTWDTIATNTEDDGDWTQWIVPNTFSTNCKIRVSDADGDPSVVSNGIFTIFSQFTEQISINLAWGAKRALGDYDNDGDLDICLGSYRSKIYRNEGNDTFTEQSSISLVSVSPGTSDWGDYDNDGYLDLLLAGYTGPGMMEYKAIIYHNNGNNTFTEIISIFTDLYSPYSALWGDYDNDGDLDILLGRYLYYNNGNNIFTLSISFPYGSGISTFGDYDNDGDQDIFFVGETSLKIFQNNGNGTFTEQIVSSLPSTSPTYYSVELGDYDNDGNLDILLSGSVSGDGYLSKLFRNNGDNTFTEQSLISSAGVMRGSIIWGDYDNDGDLDILLSGWGGQNTITKIYRNNGDNTFTE